MSSNTYHTGASYTNRTMSQDGDKKARETVTVDRWLSDLLAGEANKSKLINDLLTHYYAEGDVTEAAEQVREQRDEQKDRAREELREWFVNVEEDYRVATNPFLLKRTPIFDGKSGADLLAELEVWYEEADNEEIREYSHAEELRSVGGEAEGQA